MAQREQHERVKRMDRWAEKLLGHKAVVVAILVVIAAASGLAMASFNSRSSGVSFERSDEASSSDVRGVGDASSDDADESSAKSSSAAEVYVDVDGAVVRLACIGSKMVHGCPKRSMPPEGLRARRM